MQDSSKCCEATAPVGNAPTGVPAAEDDRAIAPADWLSLAAAPTFIAMAFATAFAGEEQMICSVGHSAFSLTGMTMMYLIMSFFHLAPWLKLLGQARANDLHAPEKRLSATTGTSAAGQGK